jgi:hypothetical protein
LSIDIALSAGRLSHSHEHSTFENSPHREASAPQMPDDLIDVDADHAKGLRKRMRHIDTTTKESIDKIIHAPNDGRRLLKCVH